IHDGTETVAQWSANYRQQRAIAHALAHSHGAVFYSAIPPYVHPGDLVLIPDNIGASVYADTYDKLVRSGEIDLSGILVGQVGMFVDGHHLTPLAQRRIARAIYAALFTF